MIAGLGNGEFEMDKRRAALTGAAIMILAAGGAAIAKPPAKTASAPAPATAGYLGTSAPDTYRILPPAPMAGTIRYQADRSTFLATRSLKDSPRWELAQQDDKSGEIMKDLACAIGVELTPQNAPKTVAMLTKMRPDIGYATNHPKDIYQRKRPYLIDEGPICIEKSDALAKSPDYPSGHVTFSWTLGLVLAELVPDRSTEILVRARAFGESRLVCGVHNMSAVESGRTNASALVAGLHGSADFRKDMEAARAEIAKARAAGPGPDPAACAAEAALTKDSPYN
jgi:acid phosphatase (class A)